MAPNGDDTSQMAEKWETQLTDKTRSSLLWLSKGPDREPWDASRSAPVGPSGRAAAALGPGPKDFQPCTCPLGPKSNLHLHSRSYHPPPTVSVRGPSLWGLRAGVLVSWAATWWPKLRTMSQPIPVEKIPGDLIPGGPWGMPQCGVLGWRGGGWICLARGPGPRYLPCEDTFCSLCPLKGAHIHSFSRY